MNTKKLLSAFLSAAIAFGSVSFSAFAASGKISIGSATYSTLDEAVAAAVNGDTIDLNNNTVKIGNSAKSFSNKSVKIQNGTIDISDAKTTGRNFFQVSGNNSTLTFNEISFTGDDYNSANAIIYAENGATVVIDYCGFDIEDEQATGGCVLRGSSKDDATFEITESTFKLSKPVSVIYDATVDIDNSSITATGSSSSSAKKAAFCNVYGTLSSDSYIKATGFYYGMKNEHSESFIVDESTLYLSSNTYDIYFTDGGSIVAREDSKVTVKKWYKPNGDEKLTEFVKEGKIKIGNTEYASLEDAVKYAQNGDSIDLQESEIKLNESTIVVDNKSVAIENGTININSCDYDGTPIFRVSGSNGVLTFNDVEIEGSSYTASALVRIQDDAEAAFKNTDIKLQKNKYASSSIFAGTDATNSKLTIRNCDFSFTSAVTVMSKLQLDMAKSDLTAKSVTSNYDNALYNVYGKISNSTVSFSGFGNGLKNSDSDGLVITNNTSLKFSSCNKGINSVKGYDINCTNDAYLMVESNSDLDYKTIKDEDSLRTYTAKLDGDEYMLLSDAVEDARSGDTITIIGNAEADKETVDEIYNKEISLKLGSYSITCEYGAADISEWIEKSSSQKINRTQVTEKGDIVGYKYTLSGSSSNNSSNSNNSSSNNSSSSSDKYTVKFNSNGGSSVTSKTVKEGYTVSKPSNPRKEGYVFAGWYTNSSLTKKYDFDEEVYDSFTLYAKWIKDDSYVAPGDDDDDDDNKNDNKNDDKNDDDDNINIPDDEPTGWYNPFYDVNYEDWFYDSVKYAYEKDLMMGVSGEEFNPYGYVTRAMFVTVLYRIENQPYASATYFDDVADSTQWYYNAVAWAYENAIVMGTSGTEFSPDSTITREQMAAMCYRYAEYKGLDTSVGENTNILSYDDYYSISEYAIPAMQYVCGSGIMQGTDSYLSPQGITTRAEAATVFTRINKLV